LVACEAKKSILERCKDFERRASVCDESNGETFNNSTFDNYCGLGKAIELVANNVSLPSSAGTADLLAGLPSELAHLYSTPSPALLREGWRDIALKKPKVFATHDEYVLLVKRLAERQMVEFATEAAVVNGLFGVEKDANSIRLILDARNANAVFVEPEGFELPTPDLLSKLRVQKGKRLFVAKADLGDYYHRLRVPHWMRTFFAIPAVKAEEVGMEQIYGRGTMIFPRFITLPMGWSHAPFLAQRRHEHVVERSGNPWMQRHFRICSKNGTSVVGVRHSIYIDDVGFIGTKKQAVERALVAYSDLMERENTPVKVTKTVRATDGGVELTGVLLNGERCTVGVDPCKLQSLVSLTLKVLDNGYCSGEQMLHILGKWAWAILVRRPVFSVFSAAYRFAMIAAKRVFRIWPSVQLELLTVCGLAPLLVSSLSAEVSDEVLASDASCTGLGVVSMHGRGEDVGTLFERELPWKRIASSRWKWPVEHINVLEARAVLTAVKWLSSRRLMHGKRVVFLCDSAVVVGALQKGRSSSYPLLRQLRKISAYLLVSGIQLDIRWIPTWSNPADYDSRRS
jgi:hypothetical protein